MAVLSIIPLAADVQLGIWKIEEPVTALLERFPHLEKTVESYHSIERKRQKLAVYALLYAMTGKQDVWISHDTNGKPLLENYQISISDTHGFAAIILSKSRIVAVDIEYMSDRVSRIVSRFLRSDESASKVEGQLIHWSAKETAFKFYSSQHLQYSEMRLHPFTATAHGRVEVDNLKAGTVLPVNYVVTSDYVLTYALEE